MLRVALVLRSTEVIPEFFDLFPKYLMPGSHVLLSCLYLSDTATSALCFMVAWERLPHIMVPGNDLDPYHVSHEND